MGRKPKNEETQLLTWQDALESAILNDNEWSAKVVILEPAGSEQDRIYLENFEEFATKEKRFVIKNICKSETIFMINQLGSDTRNSNENNKVFEEAHAYIKEKVDIPSDILALVIKHLILKMKEDDLFIKRQKIVVKDGISRESHTMLDKPEVRGTVNVKIPMSPLSSDKRNVPNEPLDLDDDKKYNTLLRTRGEEWRDKAYVEDYPIDGPCLYIIVSNFQDPYLPTCLTKILVPLTAVIQVRIDLPLSDVPQGLIKPNKRGQEEIEALHQEQALQFWLQLLWYRINLSTTESLKDSAFIVFFPPYWDWQKLTADPEKIYDEICYLVYDIQDLSRQHSNFLDNIKLIEIPTSMRSECNMKPYKERMNDIPFESVTIYSVLDSILETMIPPSSTSESSVDSTDYQDTERGGLGSVAEVVNKVFKTLNENNERKTYRTTQGEEMETLVDPTIIEKGDIVKYTTFHLGNIGLDSITMSSLRYMPLHQLWVNLSPLGEELSAKVSYHVNVLLSCFDRKDIETAELTRLLHILSCKVLYNHRSSLQEQAEVQSTISKFKNVYLKRSIMAEPIKRFSALDVRQSTNSPNVPSLRKLENDSLTMNSVASEFEVYRTKSLFDCPDISELVTPEEIEEGVPLDHIIDDYVYFEDFRDARAFQILRHAYNTYNCVNYKYCEVTDCIIMMFMNSYDDLGISREEWRCHIPTSVCLQDFFDFVLEEHYDWVQEEENKYNIEMAMKTDSSHKSVLEAVATATCITNENVNSDMLMEGSLKFEELMNTEIENLEIHKSKSSIFKKKNIQEDVKNVKILSKQTPVSVESMIINDLPEKPFSGYDLGDRRVEVFGKDTCYFGKDGTEMSTNYYLMIPSNYEWVTLKVVPGKTLNQIWVHRVLGDVISDLKSEVCESFRISCKNEMLINCKKINYGTPPIPMLSDSKISDNGKHNCSPILEEILPIDTFYYSLNITWANGLFIETIHVEQTQIISHIKMTYLKPIPTLNEEKRCISLNGEVIIFKSSGDIEVLRPDSTYIKITKMSKIAVAPTIVSEEQASVTTLKKDKKKIEKPTPVKGKPGKKDAESSSIKNEIFTFIIDDYMIINSNGDTQNYIKNNFIGFGQKLLIRTATDYNLGEVFSRRLDGTNILINSDGLQITTFPDGTRIITDCVIEDEEVYPEWSEEDLATLTDFTNKEETEGESESEGYISIILVYTVEHKYFPTVKIDNLNGRIVIDSPNDTSVTVNFENQYDMQLDDSTSVKFHGEKLEVNYKICGMCRYNTKFEIQITKNNESVMNKTENQWMKMKDYLSNIITVSEEGGMERKSFEEYQLSQENTNCDFVSPTDSKLSNLGEVDPEDCCKCDDLTEPPAMRFFIMDRQLNCSELLHKQSIERTMEKYEGNPWYSCNKYDTFGDYRTLLSILSPIQLNESDKWLMESSLSGKPRDLTFKDLKVDEGKGFYHWMRPYERFVPSPRKPASVLPSLPRAYKLRTLEKQFSRKHSAHLNGAKELIRAILQYRKTIAVDSETILSIPIIENRSCEEIKLDNAVQKIAKWVFNDLKHSVSEAAEKRAKLGITTRPLPLSRGGSLDEASEVMYPLMVNEDAVKADLDAVRPMSPALKRYWRRRKEELKEEEFYQYLLREGTVPPYFRNILGGAIWWEVNNLVDKATGKSEKKKMMCVCDENTFKDTETTEERVCEEMGEETLV